MISMKEKVYRAKKLRGPNKNRRSIIATSEVIEHVLLLLIAVSSCAVIYYNVLAVDLYEKETNVLLTGSAVDKNLIIEHSGGVPIDLESRLMITLAGNKYNEPVGNRVQDNNHDGYWSIGERMSFPINYELIHLWKYRQVSMSVVDRETNSMIFLGGDIGLVPKSDAEVTLEVSDSQPEQGDILKIWINVTSYGGDVNGSANVTVLCLLPEGLIYSGSESPSGHGVYNNVTGLWSVGNVFVGSPATLLIYALVDHIGDGLPTQFVVINDVSKWMYDRPQKWNQLLEGLGKGISDEIPQTGNTEFSFIKYGYTNIPRAEATLEPTILTEDNCDKIATDLRNPQKNPVFGGRKPMCSGIRLAADLLYESQFYDPKIRQVVLLITSVDGDPDCVWVPGSYNASPTNPVNYTTGRLSTENAIEYLKFKLNLTEDRDQIDILMISDNQSQYIEDVPIIPWFNTSIAWPYPNIWNYTYLDNDSSISLPSDPGWIAYIHEQSPNEFKTLVQLIFRYLLGFTEIDVKIIDSVTYDPQPVNDNDIIILHPKFI